jgi:hypothetical protein
MVQLRELKESLEDSEVSKLSVLQSQYKTTGWTIKTKVHARARAYTRHPTHTAEDWIKFHRNIVHAVIKSRTSGNHVIFSKSHNIGVVANVDRKNKMIEYHTVLSSGKHHADADANDTKLMVEYKIVSFCD